MADPWRAKVVECESGGLPFTFHHFSAAKHIEPEWLVDYLVLKDSDTEEFYVGGTRDPVSRWSPGDVLQSSSPWSKQRAPISRISRSASSAPFV